MWHNDLVKVLVDASYGTYATDIFASLNAQPPEGPGPYTMIATTGGSGPDWTQNEEGTAYDLPGAAVTVIAEEFEVAMAKALEAYQLYAKVTNVEINGVWYTKIKPMQYPFELPLDDNHRAQIRFNVLGHRRP